MLSQSNIFFQTHLFPNKQARLGLTSIQPAEACWRWPGHDRSKQSANSAAGSCHSRLEVTGAQRQAVYARYAKLPKAPHIGLALSAVAGPVDLAVRLLSRVGLRVFPSCLAKIGTVLCLESNSGMLVAVLRLNLWPRVPSACRGAPAV
jgi:hypothetical protein